MKKKNGHRRRLERDDTLVSGEILLDAVKNILKGKKLDHDWDIPYLAGYSRDGKTIYIDRHLPRTIGVFTGKEFRVDPYLILHESVEKSLIDGLGLHYQHAHQIALRAEEAAVRADGIGWRIYDRFMRKHIKTAGDERLERIPPDLDITPYHDEHDSGVLKRMRKTKPGKKRKGKIREACG